MCSAWLFRIVSFVKNICKFCSVKKIEIKFKLVCIQVVKFKNYFVFNLNFSSKTSVLFNLQYSSRLGKYVSERTHLTRKK